MFIVPTGKLKDWLAERSMPEADDGLVLSEHQQTMLPGLRQQAAAFKHYDDAEREAWAIWTAYTHVGHSMPPMGTPVVFGGAGTDDLGPTLAIARSSVSSIAKTAHAVDSAIRGLPATVASLDAIASAVGDHHGTLVQHTDRLQACGRELALALVQLNDLVKHVTVGLESAEKFQQDAHKQQIGAADTFKAIGAMVRDRALDVATVGPILGDAIIAIETVKTDIERVASQTHQSTARIVTALDDSTRVADRVHDLVRTMEAFTLHWPDGPVTVMPTIPPAPPLPWHAGPLGVWLRWGAIVAVLVADMALKAIPGPHGR